MMFIHEFIAWLETKPPELHYDASNPNTCAIAQFGIEMWKITDYGIHQTISDLVGEKYPDEIWDHQVGCPAPYGVPIADNPFFAAIAHRDRWQGFSGRTYGALAQRLKALVATYETN